MPFQVCHMLKFKINLKHSDNAISILGWRRHAWYTFVMNYFVLLKGIVLPLSNYMDVRLPKQQKSVSQKPLKGKNQEVIKEIKITGHLHLLRMRTESQAEIGEACLNKYEAEFSSITALLWPHSPTTEDIILPQ